MQDTNMVNASTGERVMTLDVVVGMSIAAVVGLAVAPIVRGRMSCLPADGHSALWTKGGISEDDLIAAAERDYGEAGK
jgi:hypothetical protein